MILKEFMDNNNDILVRRITMEELPRVTEYQALIMIKLAANKKEKEKAVEDRKILDVYHIMPIFNGQFGMQYIRETNHNNAKLEYLSTSDTEDTISNYVLFYTRPFEYDDIRRQTGWISWKMPGQEERR